MLKYPQPIEELIRYLRKFPSVGRKTAERFAFHLIGWAKEDAQNIARCIEKLPQSLQLCKDCAALIETTCPFCTDKTRDRSQLCIVASPRDIFLIEESRSFKGLYHTVDKLLSPIDGIDPSYLRLEALERRLRQKEVKEVIFALDTTIEGDATALYLKDFVERFSITTSRLAFGIPLGSSLEYTDEGTLARALSSRQPL